MENKQTPKITLDEYQKRYNEKTRTKTVRGFLAILVSSVAIIIVTCLLLLTLQAFNTNMYLGIGVAVVAVLIFVFLFIVPLVKILKLDRFNLRVNGNNLKAAKAHNKKLRRQLADGIIDMQENIDNCTWYDEEKVTALKGFCIVNDDGNIKKQLTEIYNGPIKDNARKMIVSSSVKCGVLSALSQDKNIDTAIVIATNMSLIKDLVYLYGFRPSETKTMKIFLAVLRNTLIAYGSSSVKVGTSVVEGISGVFKDIPLLGSIVSMLIDSTVNGLTNGALTTLLGYQTIKYLNKEYHLQNILDNVVEEDDATIEGVVEEVKNGIIEESKPKKITWHKKK